MCRLRFSLGTIFKLALTVCLVATLPQSNHGAVESLFETVPGPAQPATIQPNQAPVTSVREIFRVSQKQKDLPFPVDLVGVVLLPMPQGPSLFFHDGDMGIHVNKTGSTNYTIGERIRLIGQARRGRFAPSIVPLSIKRLGAGQLPAPSEVPFSELVAGMWDSQWIETEAVVSKIQPSPNKQLLIFEVIRDGQRLRISAGPPYPEDVGIYLDAEVKIRGVSGARFNTRNQMTEAILCLPNSSWIDIIQPAPQDPFELPVRSANRLMEFSADSRPWHRVKTRGVVTRRISSNLFFLLNQEHGIRVESLDSMDWQPGDIVEAVGFPMIVDGEVVIENAISRRVGREPTPLPSPATPSSILNNHHTSNLVHLEGRMIDSVTTGSDITLVFETENHLFKVLLENYTAKTDAPPLPENNSIVRITGICVIKELQDLWYRQPSSFTILIASREDLQIIANPPWWTPQRLSAVLAVALTLLIVGGGWVWALRRQVDRSRSVLESQARHAAVLEERTRIGHDLHDTLEQGLTGLSLQLKGIETDLQSSPHPASSRVVLARQMLRQSRGLARDAIRKLRVESTAPDRENLLLVLRKAVEMWNRSGALTAQIQVHGTAIQLPNEIERNLRGIGMEAMTNAVKHGHATLVNVDVEFGPSRVGLRVTDNGSGFDSGHAFTPGKNSYGLVGMRERCLKIGASLSIESQPGHGTEIAVSSPYTAPLPI